MAVRLDRLQQGLFEALGGVADAVAWAHGQPPQTAGSRLSLMLQGGPSPHLREHARGVTMLAADTVTITVGEVAVGRRLIVRLNDFDYRHDVADADTVASVRESLSSQIVEGEQGGVAATLSGLDALVLTSQVAGGLRSLELFGEALSSSAAVFSDDVVRETRGTAKHAVTLQAYSQNSTPRNGAAAVMGRALDRLQDVDVVAELTRYGLGMWGIGNVIDLTAISGEHWETRCSVDITVAAQSVAVAKTHHIEGAIVAVAVT